MNGVTGRMGTNQHLVRSILAIREQGGIDGVCGRSRCSSAATSGSCARWPSRTGSTFTTDLERGARRTTAYEVYFDAQVTSRREAAVRAAIGAGKHVYCEKPIAEDLESALELARLAEDAGIRHGVVQDKLFLPGHPHAQARARQRRARPRSWRCAASSATGSSPAPTRSRSGPSWNYRAEDGGGIVGDMFSHWRYVLDELFGSVRGVFALGATHLPPRYDEQGEPYDATAEDAAYAIFELEDGVIAQLNSSWCVRVDRGELFELQVDGTEGSAVAGLRECRIQPGAATPRAVWNPDLPDPIDHRAAWLPVPAQRDRQRLQGPVGALPAPRRARRAVPVGLPRRGPRRPARRARHAVVARAAVRRGAAAVTLLRAGGRLEPYTPASRALRGRAGPRPRGSPSPPPTWSPTRSAAASTGRRRSPSAATCGRTGSASPRRWTPPSAAWASTGRRRAS